MGVSGQRARNGCSCPPSWAPHEALLGPLGSLLGAHCSIVGACLRARGGMFGAWWSLLGESGGLWG
eukprot:4893312-Pyramimonas_sp.AAC.1